LVSSSFRDKYESFVFHGRRLSPGFSDAFAADRFPVLLLIGARCLSPERLVLAAF
jgi:hypothetical protein